MNDLDDRRAATARSRAYLLLGRLFLRGVTDEVLEHVRSVDALAEHLGAFSPGDGSEVDLDEAAAAHHQVFGFNVFAYQSTFIDHTARAGGRETERVSDFYRRAGFPIVETSESADHLGVELNFLGFLSKMEAENDGDDARMARQLSRAFLDLHLLEWIAGLAYALETHGHPFFSALGELTVETLLEHRRSLPTDGPPGGESPDEFAHRRADHIEPRGSALLEDQKTGLRDIAEYLLVPAEAGIYLSRASIRALSRTENLPAGFGTRANMMSNLLRSAVDYDGLDEITRRLAAHVAGTRRAWRSFAGRLPGVTDAAAEPWLERLDATSSLFAEMRAAWGRLRA